MIYQSNVTDRSLFNNAQAAMIAAGISQTAFNNAVKTQGVLRLIQPITTGSQIIQFPVLTNQTGAGQATRPDEVRLPQQNAFFVGQAMFSIFLASSSTSTSYIPRTYPNNFIFANAANLYNLYNGVLKITIDQSVITRAYSMRKFLSVPVTQQTAALASGFPQDQYDGTLLLPWEPNIVFVGTSQIDISIYIPTSLGTIDANTYGCWDFFGIEAQNVALGAIQ